MSDAPRLPRRAFVHRSLAAASLAAAAPAARAADAPAAPAPAPDKDPAGIACGTLGKAKISRLLLGGNLIGGWMHARDLKYVNGLFKAYATEAKILETLQVAESQGINTVFETGGNYIEKYNRTMGGHMQFIPHLEVKSQQTEAELKDHIKKQVDTGAVALYVWGESADRLVRAGATARLGEAVVWAKEHGLPVGVGSHSLLVPMACEKEKIPCDFYVKTLHEDTYFSATPKHLRKEFIWVTGGEGWHDNMWCINPEETVAFMKTVTKPWIAFKVLAAGAYLPREGFSFALRSGADFLAVGMLDFQIKGDCEEFRAAFKRYQQRERPWHG
jgi:hypothetical protein